jgi:hypothetical protein
MKYTSAYLNQSDSGGTRTHNQQNRNLSFYPLNYGARGCKYKKNGEIMQKRGLDFSF